MKIYLVVLLKFLLFITLDYVVRVM